MRNLNLDQLQTLIAIADLGTFAAAAQALHLAPPTVSMHIKELESRLGAELVVRGVEPGRIVLDPGLGFAKDAMHNWQLLGRLEELASLGHGILIGASRKRFIGALLPEGAPMEARDEPTAVVSALAARSGAWAVRVHDVPSTRRALDVWERWQDGSLR